MTKTAPSNLGASVRQRLLNLAQKRGEEFQSLLTRYANERLIYRLAVSRYANDFVLKGAMLLYAWTEHPFRATQDVDLLGRGNLSAEGLLSAFREIAQLSVPDDGLVFDAASITVGLIRALEQYGGYRVKLLARLASARMSLQVDIGVGDAVTPRPVVIDYPTLLDFPAPRLRAYSREASVAEKFHAMVNNGLENSRMKDFFDVWALCRAFPFNGQQLSRAIRATFTRRKTAISTAEPVAFTAQFVGDEKKVAQWKAFITRTRLTPQPPPLGALTKILAEFLLPPATAARQGADFAWSWPAGGPSWTRRR